MDKKSSALFLPLIVFAQFAGTSLWFAGNAIIQDLQANTSGSIAGITTAVQFGFITGTLLFAILSLADRIAANKLFFLSSLVAAFANLLLVWLATESFWLFTLRFITGFFLAGIYPVGMKIAADHFPQKLGNALGFLVGALVLGTAFPHVLRSQLQAFRWQDVIWFTSLLALIGGLLILVFGATPGQPKPAAGFRFDTSFSIFRSANFRSASFGYFGHMWELYTFWAFIPMLIERFNQVNKKDLNISSWSFLVIAAGSLGCVSGGLVSKKWGSRPVAFYSLMASGLCCLLAPFSFQFPTALFLFFVLVWGFSVVADSPQFSTLVAQSAPAANKGTALTIVTSVGFAITIASIQLLKPLYDAWLEYALPLLFAGPLFGLLCLRRYRTG